MIVATRFWASCHDDVARLGQWVRRAEGYATRVVVGVRVEMDIAGSVAFLEALECRVPLRVVPITPWNGFTTALNTLLYHASAPSESGYLFGTVPLAAEEYILFQSVEVVMTRNHLDALMAHMTEDTLVVGSALEGAHEFQEGTRTIGGLSCVWNTNAVWHLRSLCKTGFLLVSDGIAGNSGPAIEEAAVIHIHQCLGVGRTRAALVSAPGIQWQTAFEAMERQQQHQTKLETKRVRAEKQRQLLGIRAGTIEHVRST